MPPKKEDKVAQAITDLAEAIKGLEKKVDGFGNKVTTYTLGEKTTATVTETPKLEEPKTTSPFPKEWRDVIDTVLNAKFKADVEYNSGATFTLTIYVPKEYSNASQIEWDTNKADRRVKIMPIHLDVAGVKDYANLVAENLGSEIRAKIAEDRAKLTQAV